MPIYGPADIYSLVMGHPDGSSCRHDFSDENKRYSAPIASDETRSLPVLECNKGCTEWALEERNGWKNRPTQVALTQTEIDNEEAAGKDARSGVNIMAAAVAEAMRQQAVRSDGVDVRQAPTRARRTR
jgi:hypothetical protein